MSDLPRGPITFLFTDIEGSTERWERDRQAMRAAGRALRLEEAIAEAMAIVGNNSTTTPLAPNDLAPRRPDRDWAASAAPSPRPQ
ncbi:MAG: hypothetical protein H0T18_01075 [Chloroflexia bacterium]|nr:hypothetical protein [Chloroflexia bacterium]